MSTNQMVFLSSRIDYPETVRVGPGENDVVRVTPHVSNVGPFNKDEIQDPLPRGIFANPAGVN